MTKIAINAERLSKSYKIGESPVQYKTLRDSIANAALAPIRAAGKLLRHRTANVDETTIWALDDVSFQVNQGDVVGIVGRNGAGKSTLLKVLSRITEPTKGYADVYGRLGSLLEVGTGFHPELTGRENIYLSAAILGMKRRDILRRFDEIIEFAEVSKFIDTAVKYYSSGMYFRLAFAVAAHMEPEILIVDEVLAVGDSAFQAKCLGKMGDVAREGRTVMFVSHNMGQVRRLCRTGFWLHEGRLVKSGPIAEVIGAYQQHSTRLHEKVGKEPRLDREYKGFVSWRIMSNSLNDNSGTMLSSDGPFEIEVTIALHRKVLKGDYDLILMSPDGQRIAGWRKQDINLESGVHTFRHRFSGLPVRPGVYYWYAGLWESSTRIDEAHLYPELIVTTQNYSGLREDWPVVVNIPCELKVD